MSPSQRDGTDIPSGPSLAVLPFVNLSPNPEHDFLAEGINEELIVQLGLFPDLLVLAGQATLKYKGLAVDCARVAEELGVRFVLQGRLRAAGSRLSVEANVTDTATAKQIWSDRYESDLTATDLFDIQDQITTRVVAAVADGYGAIARTAVREAARKRTKDLTAYEAVLRYYSYNTSPSDPEFHRTLVALQRAVEKDPDYALAWALLAEIHVDDALLGYTSRPDLLDRAFEYAGRALALDPNCQPGHLSMAWAHFLSGEIEDCLREVDLVIDINPNEVYRVGFAGWLMALAGEWERGLALLRKGMHLNPSYPGYFHVAPCIHAIRAGDYERALEAAQKIKMPDLSWNYILLAAILGNLGRTDEGWDAVEALLAREPDFTERAREYIGLVVIDEKTRKRILDGLFAAGLPPVEEGPPADEIP